MKQSITFVIPVYKKRDLVIQSLRANLHYFSEFPIIIINDDPENHLPQDLPRDLADNPQITWLNNVENLGFGKTVNRAMKTVQTDYAILLNSDVFLCDTSWIAAPTYMDSHPNVAAIGFAQREKTDGPLIGRNAIYFSRGLFHHRGLTVAPEEEHGDRYLSTAWAEGGSSIFRMTTWKTLGGFDERFSPFYWEDVDYGFTASKHDLKTEFAPHIVVNHRHESTIGSFYDRDAIHKIAFRHQIVFTQKHANVWQSILFMVHAGIRRFRTLGMTSSQQQQ